MVEGSTPWVSHLIVIPKKMVLLDSVLSWEWLSYLLWKTSQSNSWWFDLYIK